MTAALPPALPMAAPTPQLSGWGRVPQPGREVRSEDFEAITRDVPLSRGLGRSYGDSSLPPPSHAVAASSLLADRILAFDPATGTLTAEAGLSLRELNRIFLPRGFWSPVTPGTQHVTLGGMVAADVHGKNHHRDGSFGAHVQRLRMRVADGRVVECGPDLEPELFNATIGGMGLTGHILDVTFPLTRVPSPWIFQEIERIPDLAGFLSALKEAGPRWPFTVGWIDCLSRGSAMGRGILVKGRWAEASEAPKRFPKPLPAIPVPFVLPSFAMGRLTVRVFNELYYRRVIRRRSTSVVPPWGFFYPLDIISSWNRLYGPRGFTQYQCVLPVETSAHRLMEVLTRHGGASFLCVIKDCGAEGDGLLSFPRTGISIALDLAIRDETQALVDALNEVVIEEGGRIYLAKDALTRPADFAAMDARVAAFQRVRQAWDPEGRIRSAQSVRLFGDRP